MSMLAERKRKQKWSLNPRGNQWVQDSNKFGQKMLEKMGWKQGKGLGAQENGITEHIKVSYKNDSKGMGYKGNDEQWTEHEDNFAALLKTLAGSDNKANEISVSSLEKKSQSSKARVHYQKFTRGKDLSRYSEKDLANIFGKKSLKEIKKDEVIAEKQKEKVFQKTNDDFLINSGSMTDYFKSKIHNFGGNSYVVNSNVESDGDVTQTAGFGFKSNINKTQPSFISYISENKRKTEDSEGTPKKKLKKKDLGVPNPAFDPLHTPLKLKKHILNPIEESSAEENLQDNSISSEPIREENYTSTVKESKKKKKCIEEPCEISDQAMNVIKYDNPSFSDSLYTATLLSEGNKYEVKRKNSKLEIGTCENPYEVKVKKKKKSAKHAVENSQFVLNEEQNSMENTEEVENPHEVKVKKKSKFAVDNPCFDPSIESNQVEDEQQNPDKVNVKSKKKNLKLDVSIQSSLNGNIENIKKDKVKNKKNILGIENISFDTSIQSSFEQGTLLSGNNLYEVKVKKEKSKFALENPSFDSGIEFNTTQNGLLEENEYEIKRKKKKSKHKQKKSDISNHEISTSLEIPTNENAESANEVQLNIKEKKSNKDGIANPALSFGDEDQNNSMSIIEDDNLMLNVVATTFEENTTDTPNTIKKKKSVRFSEVTQKLIIPNNEDIKNGVANQCFDEQKHILDENIEFISKTLDRFEAEIENDMNEEKQLMVGEIGNPDGDNEKLPDGSAKLKFKHANLCGRSPYYHQNLTGAKKGYKHLIKGDIVVKFKETNLHKIEGYANKKETLV